VGDVTLSLASCSGARAWPSEEPGGVPVAVS
jgi:hypothetical protein